VVKSTNYEAPHYVIFTRSLHVVHEMKAYTADHACLSVRMIQLENRWSGLDEISHGSYAIGVYPKNVLFSFLQSVIPTWR
jgi:hypothetical protein